MECLTPFLAHGLAGGGALTIRVGSTEATPAAASSDVRKLIPMPAAT